MRYKITSKQGQGARDLVGTRTHKEVMGFVNMFMMFNQDAQHAAETMDDAAKIAYVSEHSFYTIRVQS